MGDPKDPSKDQLPGALAGAQVVVITAGVARKPGMTRDDLFNINAGIISNLASGIAKYVFDIVPFAYSLSTYLY